MSGDKTQADLSDEMLDEAFAALRKATPPPGPAFMERVMADALAERPQPPVASGAAGWLSLARIGTALGGWRGGVALAGSAIAGLCFGYLSVVPVDTYYSSFSDADLRAEAELDDPFADLLGEGDT